MDRHSQCRRCGEAPGDEDRVRSYYETRARELKQGSILLMDHAGGIQAFHWSPKVEVRNG